jgi:bifunctional DNA-binding transcriptional regulator/antitoxin component of YhaV-PrlF toxin-antitoxin module
MNTTPKIQNHKSLRAQVRSKNQITLPQKVCELTGLKEGEYVVFHVTTEMTKVAPGSVVLSPHTLSARPWSASEWKEKEREADADIKAGRVSREYGSMEDAVGALKKRKRR